MKTVIQMLEGQVKNMSMPPNPFAAAATNPTRTNAGTHRRVVEQELGQIISELEWKSQAIKVL